VSVRKNEFTLNIWDNEIVSGNVKLDANLELYCKKIDMAIRIFYSKKYIAHLS